MLLLRRLQVLLFLLLLAWLLVLLLLLAVLLTFLLLLLLLPGCCCLLVLHLNLRHEHLQASNHQQAAAMWSAAEHICMHLPASCGSTLFLLDQLVTWMSPTAWQPDGYSSAHCCIALLSPSHQTPNSHGCNQLMATTAVTL
jgi:hypothetical protein